MPAEAGVQSRHIMLTFEVDDITNEVRDLQGRGVGFLDYDTQRSRPLTTSG